jgi:hypothetical protein
MFCIKLLNDLNLLPFTVLLGKQIKTFVINLWCSVERSTVKDKLRRVESDIMLE